MRPVEGASVLQALQAALQRPAATVLLQEAVSARPSPLDSTGPVGLNVYL